MNSDETIRQEKEYVEEEGSLGFADRVLSVFIAPREVCRSLMKRPEWLRALVVVAVVIGITAILVTQENATFTRDMMNQAGRVELTEEQLARMSEVSTRAYVTRGLGGVFWSVVQALLFSLVLFLCGKGLGAKAKFKQVFSIVAYSGLIGALGAVVMAAVVKLTGTFPVETSLGVLAGDSYWSLTRVALSNFEIFWVWQLAFLTLGLAVVEGFSMGKAVFTTVVLFLLRLAVLLGITAATRGILGIA